MLSRQAGSVAAAVAVLLAGCAGFQDFRDGKSSIAQGDAVGGLDKLHAAMNEDPESKEYRRTYFVERERALNKLFGEADAKLDAGDFAGARTSFAAALKMDPKSQRAAEGEAQTDVLERNWKALDVAEKAARGGDLDTAIADTRQVLSENATNRRAVALLRQLLRRQADVTGKDLGIYPKLNATYRVPVSLSVTNATLLQVFDSLKLASGLNYVLDRDVKQDLRVTLSVTKKPVDDVLRLLLATNQLDYTVLDDDTMLVYPNTPAKAQEYKAMVVRTFYLRNTDATKMADSLRTIAKAHDVVVDTRLNAIIVRDSAEVIRLAERLIAAQDLAEPEVMLELEVLEVSTSRLMDLGLHWPDSVSASVMGAGGVAGQLSLNELRHPHSSMVNIATDDPVASAQLKSVIGSADLLANPRVRVRNNETAKVLIGERVPVITTTATANVGTSQSVNYLDVGLKLEIQPTISLDDEVSMKIGLEVSSITQTITLTGGAQAYRLGTRNTSTTLRVHDGETNILAGLIQRDEQHSNTGIPGLNELPLISRLFGAAEDSDSRTEIVLLITPRVVRNLDVPGIGQQEFLSGTANAVGAAPIQLGMPTAGASAKAVPRLPVPAARPGFAGSSQNPAAPPASPPVAPPAFYPNPAPPAAAPAPATAASEAAAVPPAFTQPPLIPSTPGQ